MQQPNPKEFLAAVAEHPDAGLERPASVHEAKTLLNPRETNGFASDGPLTFPPLSAPAIRPSMPANAEWLCAAVFRR